METAQTVINTPAEQSSATSATESTLDFMDTGGGGHFTSVEKAFPGMTIGEGLSNIVLQATGTLTITSAQAGYYTFGVNSDDGFKLTLTGASFSNGAGDTTCSGTVLEYDGGRGAADTLGTTYLAPGSYPINLVYFQGNGGDSMEFYAAKESSSSGVTSFDANSILVGNTTATTASGGTSTTTTPLLVTSTPFAGSNVSPLAASIQTNVYSTVQAAIATAGSTSLYSRITFNDSASLTSLTLRMQYASGYVAYFERGEDRQQQRADLAYLELDRLVVSRQSGAGLDLRGHRPLVVLELRHDGPPDGHQQRAGDPDADGPVRRDQQHHLQRDDRHGHDDLGQRLLHRR